MYYFTEVSFMFVSLLFYYSRLVIPILRLLFYSRLVISILRNLFFGPKIAFPTGILRIFSFSCVFPRKIFLEERGFEGGRRNSYVRRPGTVGLVQTGFLRGFLKSS